MWMMPEEVLYIQHQQKTQQTLG